MSVCLCLSLGSNKVTCEICGCKQDAKRGIILSSLPPYLTIQLSRFQMNWNTGVREKIIQKFSIPALLNMNNFQGEFGIPANEKGEKKESEIGEEAEKLYDLSG